MRATGLVLTALVLAGTACVAPTRPASPVGVWTLVGVDGSSLPAAVLTQVDIVSGSLELKGDGTYEESTQTRVAGEVLQSTVRGDWRVSGTNVELLDRIVGLPFLGRWNGSTLEIQGELAMRYAR